MNQLFTSLPSSSTASSMAYWRRTLRRPSMSMTTHESTHFDNALLTQLWWFLFLPLSSFLGPQTHPCSCNRTRYHFLSGAHSARMNRLCFRWIVPASASNSENSQRSFNEASSLTAPSRSLWITSRSQCSAATSLHCLATTAQAKPPPSAC